MNILYISQDYTDSKVHHNLCHHLASELGPDSNIIVYTHSRDITADNIDKYDLSDNYRVILPKFKGNKFLYKYLFNYKISLKYKELSQRLNLRTIDLVHAATLFSEGAVAYKIWKKFKIPYAVAVRGTDINTYFGKMPHIRKLGIKILRRASKVIFISDSLKNSFFNVPIIQKHSFEDLNYIVLPNAIDKFYLENITQKKEKNNPRKLLFIGRFDRNKNIERLMDAVELLNQKYKDISLSLIGGYDNTYDIIMERWKKRPEIFSYLGEIRDKNKLVEIMRSSDVFVMVSHSETFGLVYIEALTQGIPVVFSENRGIDGLFTEKIGEAVNPVDVESIARGIEIIINNYSSYFIPQDKLLEFSWSKIACKYVNIYKQIIKK